jgi:hypothetical protein
MTARGVTRWMAASRVGRALPDTKGAESPLTFRWFPRSSVGTLCPDAFAPAHPQRRSHAGARERTRIDSKPGDWPALAHRHSGAVGMLSGEI